MRKTDLTQAPDEDPGSTADLDTKPLTSQRMAAKASVDAMRNTMMACAAAQIYAGRIASGTGSGDLLRACDEARFIFGHFGA